MTVDARGSGTSFGQWYIPWSPEEIADLGEVVDWIVAQSWSNGRVGTFGVSYDGNTAEMVATLNHPAVKAVVTQYSDFDVYAYLLRPGGIETTKNRGQVTEPYSWNPLKAANFYQERIDQTTNSFSCQR